MNVWLRNILLAIGAFVAFLIIAAILFSAFTPRPVSWYGHMRRISKDPYGTTLIYQQLKQIFPGKKVSPLQRNELNVYSYYGEDLDSLGLQTFFTESEVYDQDGYWTTWDTNRYNLLSIGSYFDCNRFQAKMLLMHVAQGNSAYIAFDQCSEGFSDIMGIEYKADNLYQSVPERKEHKYRGVQFNDSTWHYSDSLDYFSYFSKIPEQAEVFMRNYDGDPVAIKIQIEKGELFISSYPYMFANYALLYQDPKVAERELLRLPNEDTKYFTELTGFQTQAKSPSVLTYFHSQPPLAWALYTAVFGLLFYLAFQIKRVQRAIPIVKEKENLSLRHVNFLADLFHERQEVQQVAKIKMDFLLHFYQKQHRIQVSQFNDKLSQDLSKISGIDLDQVKRMFVLYHTLLAQTEPDKNTFIEFNSIIQLFKIK